MKSNLLKIILPVLLIFICVFAANAQSGGNKNKTGDSKQTEDSRQTTDTPLKIIKKDPPSARLFAECFRQYGTAYVKVAARVTFDKSGVVTGVELVKTSDCREFDEESVRVAKRIKFNPATKDGEAITVTKIVVYEGGVR